jgi:hypothetical protein
MKQILTFCLAFVLINLAQSSVAQEVKINTNLAVESDGTVRMDNSATVWDDLRVPMNFGTSSNLATTWTSFLGNTYLDAFKASGTDALYFQAQLPHNYKEGTDIYAHIHWSPITAPTSGNNGVYWDLEYTWANNGETFPATSTLSGYEVVPALTGDLVAKRHYITKIGTSGISGSGKAISSMIICRIARLGDNVNDTYSGLAGALEVDFHYQVDTFGSREEYTK